MLTWISLPVLSLALALPPGGEVQKYIQDNHKMAPAKAGPLNMYSQFYAMQCGKQPSVAEVKAFERTSAFRKLHKRSGDGGAIGLSALQEAMADYGESINCEQEKK